MTALRLLQRLHQHRMWSNHQVIEVARSLNAEQLHLKFSIGQGSVWRTLTHLYAAEYVWLEALQGNASPQVPGDLPGELPGNQNGKNALNTLTELIAQWHTLDRRWQQYFVCLSEESLEFPIAKISTSSGAGKRHLTNCSDVLLHVCTHAQYTTAQLINMFRQLGCNRLPDVMLITLARQDSLDHQLE